MFKFTTTFIVLLIAAPCFAQLDCSSNAYNYNSVVNEQCQKLNATTNDASFQYQNNYLLNQQKNLRILNQAGDTYAPSKETSQNNTQQASTPTTRKYP